MHYGDTTVLSTATASKEPREGIDFFPLSVEYEEKMYAVGKIPGGFNKREGKASEHAILTSRVIDRPMRPLFPKDYRNDVTLVNMVMSVDPECNPEIPAMLGSSIATCISDIPFDGPDVYKRQVSLRSNGRVDVSKVAVFFGGGGHTRAAGCDLQGSMYDVINNITAEIEKQLTEEENA